MTLRIAFSVLLVSLAATGSAWAQSSSAASSVQVDIGYQALPYKSAVGNQGGVQVSDSSILHLGIGAETGYDTNVFYSDTGAKGSGILQVLPFVELSNATRGGAFPSEVFYDLGATLTYREYLSSDPLIRQQRAFMPGAYGNLELGHQQTVSFIVNEAFNRTVDPPYIQNSDQPITRNVNLASAGVRWAPGGGRLAGVLTYSNTLDIFDTDNLKVANSMAHLLMLDTTWKWLPKTALVLQISQGYNTYLNSQNGVSKPNSFPFHVMTGLRGLITAKLTANVLVGYANGFYDLPSARSGPVGLKGHLSVNGDLSYRPTMLTSIALGYQRDFQNAILGDFYYVDSVRFSVGQAFAGRFGLGFTARYDSRTFENIPLAPVTMGGVTTTPTTSRHDNYWQVGANLDYHIRDWTYIGVAYTLLSNSSDYEPLAAQDPGRVNYLKQLAFARIGIAY